MTVADDKSSAPAGGRDAYLAVRDGDVVGELHRLVAGQVTTLGRAPTNRVVVRDEMCSRKHCEISQIGNQWVVRDLGSRNGTRVADVIIQGDWDLTPGVMLQIGSCRFRFSYRPDDADGPEGLDSDTAVGEDESAMRPAIMHRTSKTRFTEMPSDSQILKGAGKALQKLFRLAIEMGKATDADALSRVIVDGLLDGTSADIGGVLLLPSPTSAAAEPQSLSVAAYRSTNEMPYERVSEYLSRLVLMEREAVLAEDVASDRHLAKRESLGEMQVRSVICCPVQCEGQIHGIVHLYSTDPDRALQPDDADFTLAVADQFALALTNLRQRDRLADGLARVETENQTLRRQLAIESRIIGDGISVKTLRDRIARIAPTDAGVLIRGESGVGKELVARSIHFDSSRKAGPFVCLNCAALSESLLESELFGHEKGAFTGAVQRKVGKFEQAHRGTLFLDEVGEMPAPIQAKFLRVLEGHSFERVGGGTQIHVDVRLVAATNRDLEESVKQGGFRKDLYFRLQVVEIFVDPLRSRKTDIPQLAEYFLERFVEKTGRSVDGFTSDGLKKLVDYDWPGNVRELQNTVERAVILSQGSLIDAEDIQLSRLECEFAAGESSPGVDEGSGEYRPMTLNLIEQQHILATLAETNWNKSQAAQILGIERSTLDRKLKRYRVTRPHEG